MCFICVIKDLVLFDDCKVVVCVMWEVVLVDGEWDVVED